MQRRNIKRKLAQTAKELSQEGLVSATSGNISAKKGRHIYIKKSGTSFKNAKPKDFVDIKNTKQASIEYKLHNVCYKARPDIKAIVHTHPLAILALSSMNIKIKSATVDFAIYFKNGIKQVKFTQPGSKKLARLVSDAIKTHNGVIMQNHGLVTVGRDIKEAMIRSIIAEKEAKINLASTLLNRKIKKLTQKQLKSIYKI